LAQSRGNNIAQAIENGESPSGQGGIAAESIREELERIISSAPFSAAENLKRFLRFAVEETVQGRGDRLKEYLIGTEVFCRGERFDPRLDSIVRVEARRLRARLGEYYRNAGAGDRVVIEFRKGSYAPAFRQRSPASDERKVAGVGGIGWLRRKTAGQSARLLISGVGITVLLALVGYLAASRIRSAAAPARASASMSIAVLPFLDMSSSEGQQYLCEGIAEEITNALSKLPGLRVAARTSAFEFKGKSQHVREIGRRLNVTTVLEGSCRRDGDRLRVTAHLANARDGYHFWSETYERPVGDIFALEDEVSLSVVAALGVRLTGPLSTAGHTIDPTAHELYLKTRYRSVRNKAWAENAIRQLEQAVARDPGYALAWAGLAEAYVSLALNKGALPREVLAKAAPAAAKALDLDDRLPEAHLWSAYVRWAKSWDWAGAAEEFKRALELNPRSQEASFGYALWLSDAGRSQAALDEIERSQSLEPLWPYAAFMRAQVLYFARQHDRAAETCRSMLATNPAARSLHYWLGRVWADQSRISDAIGEIESSHQPEVNVAQGFGILGSLYARAGRRSDAIALLNAARERSRREYVSPVSMAHIFIGLGDTSGALDCLEKAYEDRDFSLTTLKVEPAFDSLRREPRFQSLITRVRVP